MMERRDVRFIFRLALELGEWNVAEILERMPCTLFDLWVAYHAVEPFGYERLDIGQASQTANLVNLFSGKSSATVEDFRLRFGVQPAQTTEAMKSKFRIAKASFEAARKAKKQ